jgi:regulator of protease activity HflC (stomatin/prohibitin superfamily)
VTVFEYERGLLYSAGVFSRVLPPGRHRIWPLSRQQVKVVDIRQATLNVSSQKTFSADPLPVTVSLGVDYQIADPALAVHQSQSPLGKLYEHSQREARGIVARATLADLMGERTAINAALTGAIQPHGSALGLEILGAEVRDLILTPLVRDLVTKEVETRMRAQAALAGAREEVATLRAMANAARILRDHPEIARLRELEVMSELSRRPGNTLVLGTGVPLARAPRSDNATGVGTDEG